MQSHSNNRQAHKGTINHNNVNFFNIKKKSFQFYLAEAKRKYYQMERMEGVLSIDSLPYTSQHIWKLYNGLDIIWQWHITCKEKVPN